MAALLDIILPVFLVIGGGYLARWRGLFTDQAADILTDVTQRFAIPCLLFLAISGLDLRAGLDPGLLISFYGGAGTAFVLGGFGALWLFRRSPEDSVAIGFSALFSNSLLLGLPIMERAYGAGALGPNYAIISIHAPLLYTIGIIVMEMVRGRGKGLSLTVLRNIVRALLTNPLVIGILLGFAVNLGGVAVPGPVDAALQLMARAALPTALFALGAVLFRYRPEGDMRAILMVGFLSLVLHPAITWFLSAEVFHLSTGQLRSAVVTAAMAPGVNTYVFANMYGAARRVAASSVLICTALSLVTAWAWLSLLP